ncbi:MAG: exodeoxyribonuclease V subunit gamma [Pseudomonadales bacterium]|nr:exodeoxyribonuclease V subunit gamma [Pseudomonadales bacterium]
MLNLFQSNQMSELSRAFCARNTLFNDPFEPLTVVVQSFGLGQWLKLQLSDYHGISCNVDCTLPATFLWKLYQTLIPETQLLNESPYDRHRLTWRIMRLLKANPGLASEIDTYLAGTGDKNLRLHQLAAELALLFDEYLMFRPDWILQWQNQRRELAGHEAWQADLWSIIQDDLQGNQGLHRAALHQRVLQSLASQSNSQQPEATRKRISIFGLSTLPPLQLQTFEALAASTEVDIYFLNPCAHYWGDIVSEKDKARRSVRRLLSTDEPLTGPLTDEDYLEVGNPLLSSLGKQGREYLELLTESNQVHSEELFLDLKEATALDVVKNDILNLTFGGEFGAECQPIPRQFKDSSIQTHICHSRLREVEVLHDQILHAIKQSPALRLNDILVMMPDVTEYAPFIQSVFSGSLAYRIADRSSVENSTLLSSFMTLLKLPELRLSGPEIMGLLEVPPIMRHFELTQENLETISYWVEESGIRWELSGKDKQTYWNLPPENQNSWKFGLNRLLLGFAMSPDQGSWDSILPFEITPGDTGLLGKLCYFIDLLEELRTELEEPRSVDAWQKLVTGMISTFYDPQGDEVLEVNQLLKVIDDISLDASSGRYEDNASRQMMAYSINQALSNQDSKAGFISGGITFATLVPMRSIPFRMVALIGMNDGDYPRDVRPHSFDLLASSPARKGDRSKKLDDRYLFLEALLSAGEIFYVSFVGKGVRDNKDRPPSVVVGEWQHYLKAVFEEDYSITHALQPFSRRYYQGDDLQSFSTLWHEALCANKDTPAFIETPLAPEESLTCTGIAQLSSFLRHPGKYFLQQRLGVYLDADEAELKDIESFELDSLERFHLADKALEILTNGQDLEQFKRQVSLSGTILPGNIGQQHLERELVRAQTIQARAADYLNVQRSFIKTDIEIAGRSLRVELDNLYGDSLVSYRAGKLRAGQLLNTWVQHLAASIARPDTSTVFVYQGDNDDAKVSRLEPLDSATAEAILCNLLALYDEGIAAPLLLPPEACKAFTASQLKGLSVDNSILKVRQDWERDQPGSEGKDRYWARLFQLPEAFHDRFITDAPSIWQPILEVKVDD